MCSAYAYHMPRIVLLTLTRSQMMFNRRKHVGAKCQSAKGANLYRAPEKKIEYWECRCSALAFTTLRSDTGQLCMSWYTKGFFVFIGRLRWIELSRSSYYRFTFLCLSFRHLVQNKQIVKVLWIWTHQSCLEGCKSFKVSLWFLKITKFVKHRIAEKCHDFHHCWRWLHHHYSQECHVRFFLMKGNCRLDSKSVISYCFLKRTFT